MIMIMEKFLNKIYKLSDKLGDDTTLMLICLSVSLPTILFVTYLLMFY